jgi:hypothetical protein
VMSHHIAPSVLQTPATEEQLRAHPVLVGLNLYTDHVSELFRMKDRALLVTEGMQ